MRFVLLLIVGCSVTLGEDVGDLLASAVSRLAAVSHDQSDPTELPVGAPKLPTSAETEEVVKTGADSTDKTPGCLAIAPLGDPLFFTHQHVWGPYVASSASPLSCLRKLQI
jgi:hypothetical protein